MSNELVTFDHPALKTVCTPLDPGDDLRFLRDMRRACEEHKGVGLAAPQIGVTRRAVFVWPERKRWDALFMLNPVIVSASPAMATAREGCLSYPGVFAPVERHVSVRVRFFDEEWNQHERDFLYFAARVVQHEIDHIDAVCRVGDAWRESQVAA